MSNFYVGIPCFYMENSPKEDDVINCFADNLDINVPNSSCFKYKNNFYIYGDEIDKFFVNFKYLNNIVLESSRYKKLQHKSIENIKSKVNELDSKKDYLSKLMLEVESLKALNGILLDKLNEEKERRNAIKLTINQVIKDFENYLSTLKND